ncbi:hypothetical protein D9M68_933900 [compost metagenome]
MLQRCGQAHQVVFCVPAVAQQHVRQPAGFQHGLSLSMLAGNRQRRGFGAQYAGIGEQGNAGSTGSVDYRLVLGNAPTDFTGRDQQQLFRSVERRCQCLRFGVVRLANGYAAGEQVLGLVGRSHGGDDLRGRHCF